MLKGDGGTRLVGCPRRSLCGFRRAGVLILVLLLPLMGCGAFFNAHVLGINRRHSADEFNRATIESFLSQHQCGKAWDIIWPSVRVGEPEATALLGAYMDKGVLRPPARVDNADQNRRSSLMLQFKAYGLGLPENDARLRERLSSSEVQQPQGSQLEMCLRKANKSLEAAYSCSNEAEALGVIDGFMKFYMDSEDASDRSRVAQCGGS